MMKVKNLNFFLILLLIVSSNCDKPEYNPTTTPIDPSGNPTCTKTDNDVKNSTYHDQKNFGIGLTYYNDDIIIKQFYINDNNFANSVLHFYKINGSSIQLSDMTVSQPVSNSINNETNIVLNENVMLDGYNLYKKINNKWKFKQQLPSFSEAIPSVICGLKFGFAKSLSDNILFISDPEGSRYLSSKQGVVFICEITNDSIYKRPTFIEASDRDVEDNFGYSIASENSLLVVGAPNNDDNGINRGSAYIFIKQPSGIWQEVKKLLNSDGKANDQFGKVVSISEKYIYIGAPNKDNGKVYVYNKNTYKEEHIISGKSYNKNFGKAIVAKSNKLFISSDQQFVVVPKSATITSFNDSNFNEIVCNYQISNVTLSYYDFATNFILTPNLLIANYIGGFDYKIYIFEY